jgi:sugar diacid utilization regulator
VIEGPAGESPPREAATRGKARAELDSQHDFLRHTIAVLDRLTAMALEGSRVEEITSELAKWIDAEVLVFDELFRPLAGALRTEGSGLIDPLDDGRVLDLVETVRRKRRPVRIRSFPGFAIRRDCVIAPVATGDRVLAFLVVTTGSNGAEDLQLMTIQHATSICALALVQAERDQELRLRYRAQFVESLLSAELQETKAMEMARLAGLAPDVAYAVFAIGPLDPDAVHEQFFNRLALELQRLGPDFAAVARDDHVALLAPVGNDATAGASLREGVADYVRGAFASPPIAIGASPAAQEPSVLRLADLQARRALSVARRLRRAGEVTRHDALGVQRLLLHVPVDELSSFAAEVLGPLAAGGAEEPHPLLATIAAYLNAGANLRMTAEVLRVHANTVSYRLHRIEELTGLSLHDPNDRMLAAIAVEVLRTLP